MLTDRPEISGDVFEIVGQDEAFIMPPMDEEMGNED
jgi:hypothetical protein